MNRLHLLFACLLLALFAGTLGAQSWQARNHGVGLYDASRDYDQTLRIVQTGGPWNAQDLLAQGSFASGSGARTFGAWLQGPPADSYKNRFGTPVYMVKYRLTDPRGQVRVFGPYGFYAPGFITAFLNLGSGPFGGWRIEWILVNRDTSEERSVASDNFEMAEHPRAGAMNPGAGQAPAPPVGLLDMSQPDYDQVLHILRASGRWSLKALTTLGAFSSGSGPKTFCAWYQGPHTRTFTNQYGTPVLMYKLKITDPRGKTDTFGPYGFTKPGFATHFLHVSTLGTYRLDWFTVHRETQAETLVQTTRFELVP